MTKLFDEMEVRTALRKACEAEGSQTAFANKHHISQCLVSHTLSGLKEPSITICEVLGFMRVHRFIKTVPASVIEGHVESTDAPLS